MVKVGKKKKKVWTAKLVFLSLVTNRTLTTKWLNIYSCTVQACDQSIAYRFVQTVEVIEVDTDIQEELRSLTRAREELSQPLPLTLDVVALNLFGSHRCRP